MYISISIILRKQNIDFFRLFNVIKLNTHIYIVNNILNNMSFKECRREN